MSKTKDQAPEETPQPTDAGSAADGDISQEEILEAFAAPAEEENGEEQPLEGDLEAGPEEEAAGEDDLAAQLEEAQEKSKKLHNDYMMVRADMDNLRKRTQRDIKRAREFAIEGFAKDLLNVADNMDRALDAMRQSNSDDAEEPSPALKAMVEGVEMIQSVLGSTLDKHGVERLESLDQPFDPNHHQAMMQVVNEDVDPDTVVQEMQPGYLLNGRLLRPAMVGVSKKES